MNETLSVISFTRSGKVLMYVFIKDNSGKDIILSKSCELIDLLISDVIKPIIEEAYKKTEMHINNVIIMLSNSATEVYQNRGYIVLDSEKEEISNADLTYLLKSMYKIHPSDGKVVINIAPLFYSVDNETNIKSPIGMCGKRLEGKFQTLFGNQKLVDKIIEILNSQGIRVNKFIPDDINIAEPFLSLEEQETLSIIGVFK